jgi:hypothetical protein
MACEGYPVSIPLGTDEFGNTIYFCADWALVAIVAGVILVPTFVIGYILFW